MKDAEIDQVQRFIHSQADRGEDAQLIAETTLSHLLAFGMLARGTLHCDGDLRRRVVGPAMETLLGQCEGLLATLPIAQRRLWERRFAMTLGDR